MVGFAEPTAPAYAAQAALSGGDAPPVEALLNKETVEVLRAYQRITEPTLRRKVLELMRAMADNQSLLKD